METHTSALRRWLLDRPQITRGSHAGGVVGGRGASAAGEYVYPEITGYYLSWLAFVAESEPGTDEDIARRYGAAAYWLQRELGRPGGPRTRDYLGTGTEPEVDWRNTALFAFDLGMVHRGLAATGAPDLPAVRHARADATALLDSLRDADGSWLSCLPHVNAGAPPDRWSTAPGPHLLKVAGGVLALAGPGEDSTTVRAARATLARHAPGLKGRLPAMSHPALYALEGLLQAEVAGHAEYHDELRHGYHELLDHADGGVLHEVAADPSSRVRSDVLAQALRVGSVLAGRGELDGRHTDRLDEIARVLVSHVDPHGGTWFDRTGDAGARYNTWCAMFAHQALAFLGRVKTGRPIPENWIRLLV
ncbi:hypothetical protein ACIQU6_22110 [Streptomyces sp. NPDC090442]|uniref:hypothetical protein n=1 Tax=Streptomyces sp. NPDC090442 TaxID=3365962 RepID=UPI00381E47BD